MTTLEEKLTILEQQAADDGAAALDRKISTSLERGAPSYSKVRQALLVSCVLEASGLLEERSDLSRFHFYKRHKLLTNAKKLRAMVPAIHRAEDIEIAQYVAQCTPEALEAMVERRAKNRRRVNRFLEAGSDTIPAVETITVPGAPLVPGMELVMSPEFFGMGSAPEQGQPDPYSPQTEPQ